MLGSRMSAAWWLVLFSVLSGWCVAGQRLTITSDELGTVIIYNHNKQTHSIKLDTNHTSKNKITRHPTRFFVC